MPGIPRFKKVPHSCRQSMDHPAQDNTLDWYHSKSTSFCACNLQRMTLSITLLCAFTFFVKLLQCHDLGEGIHGIPRVHVSINLTNISARNPSLQITYMCSLLSFYLMYDNAKCDSGRNVCYWLEEQEKAFPWLPFPPNTKKVFVEKLDIHPKTKIS